MPTGSDFPSDIKTALTEAGLAVFFAECTPAHRREYLKWIGEAKRPETRAARIAKTITLLAAKSATEAVPKKSHPRKS